MPHSVTRSKTLASLIGLTLVLVAGADARSLMKRAHDQLHRTRGALEKGVSDGRLDEPAPEEAEESPPETGKDKPAAAPAVEPPAPPRIALDRSQAWADACEADARRRVKELRPATADVTFRADDAKEWQESTDVRGVEGKGDFLGWGATWNAFSYRCRYDVGQGKATWGRVTIGR